MSAAILLSVLEPSQESEFLRDISGLTVGAPGEFDGFLVWLESKAVKKHKIDVWHDAAYLVLNIRRSTKEHSGSPDQSIQSK